MYKWFLAWRYLRTKIIAYFGVLAVMLCVAMVLVVLSVMGGFLDTVRARSRGLLSEIIVDSGSIQGFPYYEEFAKYLIASQPEVVEAYTPLVWTYGVFRVPASAYTKTARVQGIKLEEYSRFNDFAKGLYYDEFYPGTTHLGPQEMPLAGLDPASGELKLPAKFEEAHERWRSKATENERAEFDLRPFDAPVYPEVRAGFDVERIYSGTFGEPTYIGPAEDGLIVGADLLHVRRNDGKFNRYLARGADVTLTMIGFSPTGTISSEPPIRWVLRYVDDSRTGIYEIDSNSVYVDFDALQKKLAMDPQPLVDGGVSPARTNQLLVSLRDGVTELDAKARITVAWESFFFDYRRLYTKAHCTPRITVAWESFLSTLPVDKHKSDWNALANVGVYTWEDLQRTFIQAVEKEKILVTILFGLISIVAIVLVGCIFYMIVEKKTKDIGILKSVGASDRGVGSLFVAYAAAVGVVGSILGIAAGSCFVWYINEIQDALASFHPQLRVWSADVYSFDRIPNVVKTADALWVGIIAIFASMVGSVIPAWIAAKIWPVRALRYE